MSKRALFDAVKAAIDTARTCDDKPFKCFGLFNDQFNQESVEDVVTYPAVFVQFDPITWQNDLGTVKDLQTGEIDLILHIGFKRLDKDNESVLDDVDMLWQAVHGLSSDEFDKLRRVREVQDVGYNNVEVWQLVMHTKLRDTGVTMKGTITHTIENLDARTESELHIENDVIRTGRRVTLLSDD